LRGSEASPRVSLMNAALYGAETSRGLHVVASRITVYFNV